MNLDDARAIVELMTENGLSEFEMEEDGVRISIKKGTLQTVVQTEPAASNAAPAPETASPAADKGDARSNIEEINAPFVGTFYNAPSPDAEPYVSAGMEVGPDSVLGIIEAMKVMNEIKAETHGIVREILAENAHPVQYGQPLFKIEKL